MTATAPPRSLPRGTWDPQVGLEFDGALVPHGRSAFFLDGFLDNAPELRRDLGLPADAALEALLAAGWRRWRERLPALLRGDFALLAWDGERRTGLLARDQLGIRPVFFAAGGASVRFAGEIATLLEALPTTPSPDPTGVAAWLARGSQSELGTLYAGIERLGPGQLLRFGERAAWREEYWRPRFESGPATSQAELEVRLQGAVDRRLDPGGTTAVTMSGGLDSATVAALTEGRAIACSAVFPEHPETDEAELIAELRERLGLEGPTVEVHDGGLLACATRHVELRRVPQRGWGDFWMLPLLQAAAARGARTVIGGDGGDEVFAPRSYLLADELRRGRPAAAGRLLRRLPGYRWAGRRDRARMFYEVAVLGALPARAARRTGGEEAPPWLRPEVVRALREDEDVDGWKRFDGPRWWAHGAHTVFRSVERVGVCDHLRLCAERAGLEARHPLLDLDLVEAALRLHPEETLDRRFNRPALRAAMAGRLPDSVRLRPAKARFQSVIGSSLAGPDGRAIERLLSDPRAALGAYVDGAAMSADLFADPGSREADPVGWMLKVWRAFNAELWLRSLNGENPPAEPYLTPSDASLTVRG